MYNNKGITLVALIITIIVLLILAMVSISLVINSGIITKTKTAVDKYSEEEMIEQIKLANQEYQMAQFTGTNLSAVDFIKGRLEEIYENVTVSPKSETKIYPITVKVKDVEYDIYGDGSVDTHIDFETLESSYGKVVSGYTGYSATDVTEWKLLYVDEENRDAFIISSNTLEAPQPTENGIPLVSKSGVSYTGSNNVASFEYGKKYNGLWLEKCNSESKYENAKATAYMCDPSNWTKYVTGKAKYAAGGPTLEILVSSIYNKQVKEFKEQSYTGSGQTIKNTNNMGYPNVITSAILEVGNLYNTGDNYWIASPSSDWGEAIRGVSSSAKKIIYGIDRSSSTYGARPVVCLPASAIHINRTGDNITLEYK